MSNALRDAVEYGMAYVHGPVDDLQSWLWTTLWATVFNPAASEGIRADMSVLLHRWRAKLASDLNERAAVLYRIEGGTSLTGLLWDMYVAAIYELAQRHRGVRESVQHSSEDTRFGIRTEVTHLLSVCVTRRGTVCGAVVCYDLKHGEWAELVARVDGV